jgi:hypothetical protein
VHGEYKTPSGKLVVVDFGVEDGSLSNVVVSGDFFLEPPEALADTTGGGAMFVEPDNIITYPCRARRVARRRSFRPAGAGSAGDGLAVALVVVVAPGDELL